MSNLLSYLNSPKSKATACMILSSGCWGFATVMSKAGLQYIPPLHLLAIQLISSITFLWLILLAANRQITLSWKTIKYGFTGILEPGLAYTFGMLGLVLTTASNASLISTTEPVLIILISWVLLREEINKVFLLLTGLSFSGVLLIVIADINLTSDRHSSWLGDGLIFLGTLCASIYVVLSHKIMGKDSNKISPISLATIQQTAGFILITLVWFSEILGSEVMDYSVMNFRIWALAISSGIVQYAMAFWFYLIGLQYVKASTAALFLTLTPVFAIAAAYFFLSEQLAILQWLGGILILIAVVSISILQQQDETQTGES